MITEEIKKFVEGYNERMDWNREILDTFDKDFVPDQTKDFMDDYFSTDKITEEGYDLESAELYTYDDGMLELQAYSNTKYGTVYFWLKPEEDKETYIRKKNAQIVEEINKTLDELSSTITNLTARHNEYLRIKENLEK